MGRSTARQIRSITSWARKNMLILANMMKRPPFGGTDIYIGAFAGGCIVLFALTWLIVRRCKRSSAKSAILSIAGLLVIVAGLALREDYHVSRAEICFNFLHNAAEQGVEHTALVGYGRGGGRFVSIGPGYIHTKHGAPPELVAYLTQKYNGWFSGTIISMRNAITGQTLPTPDRLSKVKNMAVPPGIEEQIEMMERAQQPAAQVQSEGAPSD
jgi:hypothetical protein